MGWVVTFTGDTRWLLSTVPLRMQREEMEVITAGSRYSGVGKGKPSGSGPVSVLCLS